MSTTTRSHLGSQLSMIVPRQTPNQTITTEITTDQTTKPASSPSIQNSQSLYLYPQKPVTRPRRRTRIARQIRVAVEFLIMYSKLTAVQPNTPALSESISRTCADCEVLGHWPPLGAAEEASAWLSHSLTMFPRPPTPGIDALLAKFCTRHVSDLTWWMASSVSAQASITRFSAPCHVGTMLRIAPSYLAWSRLTWSRCSWMSLRPEKWSSRFFSSGVRALLMLSRLATKPWACWP
mmetsp:Transcript_71971/g.204217  ORF Transcript_71971/g.204217 Transcript_71971/m.204217 type:complete len:236 (-) Transcript_71971:560-1267(-)